MRCVETQKYGIYESPAVGDYVCETLNYNLERGDTVRCGCITFIDSAGVATVFSPFDKKNKGVHVNRLSKWTNHEIVLDELNALEAIDKKHRRNNFIFKVILILSLILWLIGAFVFIN